MGLYIATITSVTKQGYDIFGGVGERLLNTPRISDLGVYNTTGSIFDYSIGKDVHDREPSCSIKSSDSVASIVAEVIYETNLMTLSEYPDRNLSEPTEPIYINANDIVVAEEFSSYTSIVLVKGGLFEKIYVSETLAEIIIAASLIGLLAEEDGILLGEDGGILLEE